MKDKEVIKAFAKDRNWDACLIKWPDEKNRTTEEIDALYEGFAIEHTSIDAIKDQREYSPFFEEKTRKIENDFSGKLDYRLRIMVPYDAAKAEETWAKIRSWVKEEASDMEDGRDKIGIKIKGRVVAICVRKDSEREPGLFFCRSRPTDDSFADRVKKLLDRKVKKLALYKDQDKTTILLVDSCDSALMSEHILREALKDYQPGGIDEIWWADTSIEEMLVFDVIYEAKKLQP